MSHDGEHALEKLKTWATKAQKTGWINQEDVQSLNEIEQQHAEQLFESDHQLPLIVAFFGGTGVGKSSLLNRLANASIAQVGVERPTSHEVTLYLHQDYQVKPLPDPFPTEKMSIRYHQDNHRRLIAWLDMPDIDSTATLNRELVLTWLPYIDWLVYVVSPERYQDDVGWHFLQQRGHRHAWLFIMNHWDEGTTEQFNDFHDRLQNSGFDNPTILRTSCVDPQIEDDFSLLESTIDHALQEQGVERLKKISQQARLHDLKKYAAQLQKKIGSKETWVSHQKQWQKIVQEQLNKLEKLLENQTNIINQTLLLTSTESSLLSKNKNSPSLPPARTLTDALHTAQSDRLLNDITIELKNNLHRENIPDAPFQSSLNDFIAGAQQKLNEAVTSHINAALANPGTQLQRMLYKFTGWLSVLLPLVAASWAVYHAIIGFYSGTQGSAFLGVDFAIHSGLLIGLVWLIPWFLQRQLRPSLTSAARRGLHQGIRSGIAELSNALQTLWDHINSQHQAVFDELKQITNDEQTRSSLTLNTATKLIGKK